MTSRYLLYKDYESGLNNNLMGLEIALGLAYLTQRKLVFYGSVGEEKNILPVRGGYFLSVPESRKHIINIDKLPTILDLVDQLPIPILTYSEFLQETQGKNLSHYHSDVRLVNAVFVPNNITINPKVLSNFAENRIIVQDVEQDILQFSTCNLAYYSRFFYLPSPSLYSLMEAIQFKPIYRNLADKISQTLGQYNGIHIRLTDYRNCIPHREEDHPYLVLKTLKEIFPSEEMLLICTDESENMDFFNPILKSYQNSIFIDQFIIGNFLQEFKELPFTDEQTLGLICNLVMWNCQKFAGSFSSTYTGIIHRNLLRNQLKKPVHPSALTFKFVESGFFPGEVQFHLGSYPEINPGLFSWNQIHLPIVSEMKSWCREWPESVCLIV
ncbi:hypothetical protein [Planktothrix pseudagardhii]|uniref:Uncharacterized protein n=1 Tax=Planktothrix pseudagardhii TaxID=132604 RepID=A0A9W4CHU7_9CYAN|nr:hypothetical protein [Planktothrix pseudagardhii]CAD5935046.1 hypothetical protein NO713_01539 [Planktothrix pseudagardhii]